MAWARATRSSFTAPTIRWSTTRRGRDTHKRTAAVLTARAYSSTRHSPPKEPQTPARHEGESLILPCSPLCSLELPAEGMATSLAPAKRCRSPQRKRHRQSFLGRLRRSPTDGPTLV